MEFSGEDAGDDGCCTAPVPAPVVGAAVIKDPVQCFVVATAIRKKVSVRLFRAVSAVIVDLYAVVAGVVKVKGAGTGKCQATDLACGFCTAGAAVPEPALSAPRPRT